MVQGRWEDLTHDWKNGSLNPFNQSEKVALDSEILSFKGSLVEGQDIIDGYFSIGGTIFLNVNTMYSSDDINHEWCHSIQERILGPLYIYYLPLMYVKIFSDTYFYLLETFNN